MSFLQSLLPVLLSVGMALTFDRFSESKGLLAPNFRFDPQATAAERQRALVRRTGSLVLLALLFWLGVFAPLGMIGQVDPAAPIDISTPDLFSLHLIFVLGLVFWYLLGFAGSEVPFAQGWVEQFGLRSENIPREIGIGVVAGVLGWIGVLAALLLVVMIVYLLGGEEVVPKVPPKIIPVLVGLPVGVRLALSLSAGVVEETFFRGFLQPRVGIATSTILFVLAHMSYEQPFMLLGVSFLSILFAMLVRWRQNIWAAMTAHAVFDAIQLLFVIPNAMEMFQQAEPEGLTVLLTGVFLL